MICGKTNLFSNEAQKFRQVHINDIWFVMIWLGLIWLWTKDDWKGKTQKRIKITKIIYRWTECWFEVVRVFWVRKQRIVLNYYKCNRRRPRAHTRTYLTHDVEQDNRISCANDRSVFDKNGWWWWCGKRVRTSIASCFVCCRRSRHFGAVDLQSRTQTQNKADQKMAITIMLRLVIVCNIRWRQ